MKSRMPERARTDPWEPQGSNPLGPPGPELHVPGTTRLRGSLGTSPTGKRAEFSWEGKASGEPSGHPGTAAGQDSSGYDPLSRALRKHHPLRAEPRQLIRINLDPQAGELRDHEQAFTIKTKRFGGDLVDVRAGREVLNVAGDRNRGGKLEIGGQADGRVPTVGDDLDIVVVRQPGDPPRLAQAAVLWCSRAE